MRTYIFIFLFSLSFIGFSQNNYIVKTEDGRRVLLKADYTWEYIDNIVPEKKAVDSTLVETNNDNSCKPDADFKEPKLDSKIQAELKKGRATIDHVKAKVAKDNDCNVEDVLLLNAKEQKTNAIYLFCANGNIVKYKRVGNSIIKAGKLF
ncbi:DUF3157 family protein [Tamlana sp. I1]|uniref:DUF3157 family protein n=1 Tax=Tamlana sp. I1 TaxID=2762061 RepID=UPI00188DF2FE|nr:DUF3157 family protein [Tamlana sp. I1]